MRGVKRAEYLQHTHASSLRPVVKPLAMGL